MTTHDVKTPATWFPIDLPGHSAHAQEPTLTCVVLTGNPLMLAVVTSIAVAKFAATPREEIEAWEKAKHGEPYKSAYFKLAAAPANIYYVLNIAGFLSNIPVYQDLPAALESFAA